MEDDEALPGGPLLPLNPIDNDFMIAQTPQQRTKIANSNIIALDQLHNLSQVDSNACGTLKIEVQDENGEWHKTGNFICRNKSENTHEKIARKM